MISIVHSLAYCVVLPYYFKKGSSTGVLKFLTNFAIEILKDFINTGWESMNPLRHVTTGKMDVSKMTEVWQVAILVVLPCSEIKGTKNTSKCGWEDLHYLLVRQSSLLKEMFSYVTSPIKPSCTTSIISNPKAARLKLNTHTTHILPCINYFSLWF